MKRTTCAHDTSEEMLSPSEYNKHQCEPPVSYTCGILHDLFRAILPSRSGQVHRRLGDVSQVGRDVLS